MYTTGENMNWYSTITKTSQLDPMGYKTDSLEEFDKTRDLRYRGYMIFEVRVPDGQDMSSDERALHASNELLSRVQRVVGDEVLFVDENSLTRM